MSDEPVIVVDRRPDDRTASLDQILEESFEGLYLWHARRTLREAERVRVAEIGGEAVGLAMLRNIGAEAGYVYYIAVSRRHRRRGVGGCLLGDALEHFASNGSMEVYASIEDGNEESRALFRSAGFRRTDLGDLSMRYGAVRALDMYRKMLVVPGEKLYCKRLKESPHPSDGERMQ